MQLSAIITRLVQLIADHFDCRLVVYDGAREEYRHVSHIDPPDPNAERNSARLVLAGERFVPDKQSVVLKELENPGSKIPATKKVRDVTELSLRESKQRVDAVADGNPQTLTSVSHPLELREYFTIGIK